MEVLFLGTGASVYPGERAQSSIHITTDNDKVILLDAGPPLQQRMLKENVKPEDVDLIIITHVHPDHVLGLPGFIHELKAKGINKTPLILAPWENVRDLLYLLRVYGPRGVDLYIKGVFDGEKHQLDSKTSIHFNKVVHPIPTFSVRITDNEISLFYSSDTAYMPQLSTYATADIAIHEATIPIDMEDKALEIGMHSSPRQAINVIKKARIKVLTHISTMSFRKKFQTDIDYIIAYDGLKIKL